jgi:hypothetical protein
VAYKAYQDAAIHQAIEDLAAWLVPHVGRYPKWIRPTIGSETIQSLLNVQRRCAEAYIAAPAHRLQFLQAASAELDCLRLLIKLSVSLRLTSHQQFGHVSLLLGETGRQLGGWLTHAKKGEGG